MEERSCYLCAVRARVFASVWSSEHGERFYCHDDTSPDCYTEATVWGATPQNTPPR